MLCMLGKVDGFWILLFLLLYSVCILEETRYQTSSVNDIPALYIAVNASISAFASRAYSNHKLLLFCTSSLSHSIL